MEMKGRKPRTTEERGSCSMKTLTWCILIVMIVQVVIMCIPLGTGGYIYIRNKENFQALANINGGKIVSDVNSFPIASLGENSNSAVVEAKDAVHKALYLVSKIKSITGEIKNGTNVFDDVRKVLHKAIAPLDRVKDMLNPHMRGTITKILDKVFKILNKMSDEELHEMIAHANELISHNNINKTMHIMDDADVALNKFDKMLSKFVN